MSLAPAEPATAPHAPVSLLERERHALEMIVRGDPLEAVLRELCLIVESQAAQPVRAAILLADSLGRTLRTGAAPSLPDWYNALVNGIAISPDIGTCAAAAATLEPVLTPDIAADPRWAGLGVHPLSLGLVAAWSMPIVSAGGRVLGTFGTYFNERREPSAHERELVAVLAHTAALAIMRHRSDEALLESEARHRFFAHLAAATQPLTEPQALMATSARLLAEQVDADRCAYARVEDDSFVIEGDYCRGVPSIVGRWPVAAFGRECVRHMLAGEAYVVVDSENDPRIGEDDIAAYRATQIRAVICVPLHKDNVYTAAMAVHQRVPRDWTAAEVQLVRHTVGSCWEMIERANVTRELQASEARYRAMIEANPECVKLVAADGTLLRMNAAGVRMLGAATEAEVVGRSIYDVIAPEHRDDFRALNERVCAGEGGGLAFDVVGVKGERRSMETVAVPISMPGIPGRVQLAVTHDVSQRVAVDRALAESRARLDYAVRLSGVGFWYCDLPFDELIWDARVREHFFLSPDEPVHVDTFYARIHPEDREPTRHAIENSIANREHYDVVYRTVDPDSGAIKWLRALGGTAYAPDGTPLRFDGVTVDVTREKQDQQRLAQLLQGERHQARLLASLARTARTMHAGGSVDSVLEVMRSGAQQLCRSRSVEVELLDSDRGAPAAPVPDTTCFSAPLLGRDSTVLGWLRVRHDGNGDFSPTDAAILAQLAQSGAVALENARLYERLREQDRRKDEFLATLAHELRNPLAPIRTGLHLIGLAPDRRQIDATLEMMERQLGHLIRMVDDLLDVSRVTRGKITLMREAVDLARVVDSALEATRALIQERGHQLVVELPSAPVILHADHTRMSQVLTNLLNNAARYTLPGGRIELRARRDGDALELSVADTGVGIPPAMLGQVFEVFTQIDRSIERSQGGLGIGLTLVRRLVELHGGTVSVHSPGPLGGGSEFIVRVPVLR